MRNLNQLQKKYKKQPDNCSCGPYAIYNLMVWLDMKPKLRKLRKILKCTPDIGTDTTEITNYLFDLAKQEDLDLLGVRTPTLKIIDRLLKENYAIVLVLFPNEDAGHYVLCLEKTKRYYYLVNGQENKPPVSRYSRKQVSSILRRNIDLGPTIHFSFAWAVRRVPE